MAFYDRSLLLETLLLTLPFSPFPLLLPHPNRFGKVRNAHAAMQLADFRLYLLLPPLKLLKGCIRQIIYVHIDRQFKMQPYSWLGNVEEIAIIKLLLATNISLKELANIEVPIFLKSACLVTYKQHNLPILCTQHIFIFFPLKSFLSYSASSSRSKMSKI